MKHFLYKEYNETKNKYLKFSSRLLRKQKNGTFQELSFYRQQQLIFRIKKLYNRLLRLGHLLKLSVAGATFSLVMTVQTDAQNITSGKIFKQGVKHPIINVRNFESNIFVQETGINNPFGTINPFDGQIIPNGKDARLVDIDNDGDLDVFVYQETAQGSGSYSIKFYRNIGNRTSATLLESQSYAFGVYFQSKPYMSFVDIDNDGDKDAVIITNGGSTLSFFENTGSDFVEHFGSENPFYLFLTTMMRYLSFADIDNDGDQDFFMQNDSGIMMLYRNTGTVDSAAFIPENADSLFQTPITGGVNSFILEDVDGDNDFDGILNGKYFFVNIGNASTPYFIEVTGGTNPFQNVEANSESILTFSDIDNDSDMDLLVNNYIFFTYYENTGSINSPLFENKSNNFNSNMLYPDFVDIDNDGDYDMFLSEYDDVSYYFRIEFYKNTGSVQNPVFEKQTALNNPLASIYSYYFIPFDFVDIDGDGDKDMFLGDYYSSMRFFKNTGTPTNPLFEEKTGNENPLNNVVEQFCFPKFVDIDGDGDQDCFYTAYDTTTYGSWVSKFMRNTGNIYNPVFQEDNNPISVTDDVFLPEFVDIDNDGDYDVFAGTYSYNYNSLWQIKFYKNTGNIYNPIIQEQPQNNNPLDIENLIPFISFVDIDKDGDKDCFITFTNGGDGQILFFRNKTINNTVQSAVKDSKFVVYPNPSNGQFEYNKETFGNMPVNISVTDISGHLVTAMEQVTNGRIDISYLEKGIYVLTIANRQQIRRTKIIIE